MSARSDPPEVQPFPEGIDVLVLPGFPDREIQLDEPGSPYPSTTVDVVKRLRVKSAAGVETCSSPTSSRAQRWREYR
jgi:hypothetical protein